MSAWVHDRIDPAEMIPPADLAELVLALTHMSVQRQRAEGVTEER